MIKKLRHYSEKLAKLLNKITACIAFLSNSFRILEQFNFMEIKMGTLGYALLTVVGALGIIVMFAINIF